MAANAIDVFTLVVPNPDYPQNVEDIGALPANISYRNHLDGSFQTLSTNSGSGGDDIKGLLYVPDLAPGDPCNNASKPFVPSNVTRQINLPSTDYDLVALAPWISANCTLGYLAAAAGSPTRAFFFYPTNHNGDQPPPVSDPMWNLNDGGRWKSENHYPVYAVAGSVGDELMEYLSHYSGNMSSVDYGAELTKDYDSRDYVRLSAKIDTSKKVALPSLWEFLVIVLSTLLVIIGVTSLTMHFLQRRRRQTLRNRVASGEVDLEALGIKRLSVPRSSLDKSPMFVYVANTEPLRSHSSTLLPATASTLTSDDEIAKETEALPISPVSLEKTPLPLKTTSPPALTVSTRPIAPCQLSPPLPPSPVLPKRDLSTKHIPTSDLAHRSPSHSQPTCSICLDDFVSHHTVVRELPCGHVFDPECIDDFLLDRSSLCPVCKKSVLPPGYCPANITNAMVRRERMMRRLRARVVVLEDGVDGDETGIRRLAVGRRMASFRRHLSAGRQSTWIHGDQRRVVSAPVPGSGTVEMAQTPTSPAVASIPLPSPPPLAAGSSRRQWARRRASAMLGIGPTVEEEEAEIQSQRPRWRNAVRRIFPGYS